MLIQVGAPPNFAIPRTVRDILISDNVSDQRGTAFCGDYTITVTPDIAFPAYMVEPAYKAGGTHSEISFETTDPSHALAADLGTERTLTISVGFENSLYTLTDSSKTVTF